MYDGAIDVCRIGKHAIILQWLCDVSAGSASVSERSLARAQQCGAASTLDSAAGKQSAQSILLQQAVAGVGRLRAVHAVQ